MNGDPGVLAVAVAALLVFLGFLAFFFPLLRLWIQTKLLDTRVSFGEIVRMRLRGLPPTLIVHAAITLQQKGVPVPIAEIADCYVASGSKVRTSLELATLVLEKRNAAS